MRPRCPHLLLLLGLLATACGKGGGSPGEARDLLALVDPTIGTGGRGWWAGNAFVGATTPFGLVQAGPDTTTLGGALPWNHCSGYHADDDILRAFSPVHLHGTGIPDLGMVGISAAATAPSTALLADPAAAFAKAGEFARPGHYTVELADAGVRAELTAGARTAWYRFTPERGDGLTVIVDLSHTLPMGDVLAAGLEIQPQAGTLSAWVLNENEFSRAFGGQHLYLRARFDRPPARFGVLVGGDLLEDQTGLDRAGKAWLVFDPAEGPVEIQVGVSYTSAFGAQANLEADPSSDFDAALAAAEQTWRDALGRARVWGGTEAQATLFATSLYHAMLMPTALSDADGSYVGLDDQTHTADGFTYLTNLSLWDTYRGLHSLLMLIAPEAQRNVNRSLVAMAADGGHMPRWPMAKGYTNIMIGTPADVVVSESVLKGLDDFDVQAAYRAMRATATDPVADGHPYSGREGIEDYLQLGYHPIELQAESVSHTLEFCVADFALARLAEHLGESDDAATFDARAQSYRNLWHPDTGYFRPRRADGTWPEPFDPLETQFLDGDAYTEGNAAQYQWLAPHDPHGLMALMGGPAGMLERLEAFFQGAVNELPIYREQEHDDLWWMTVPPKHYWHGNEPDLHASLLFLQAGRPDLAQEWIAWIRDTLYTTEPDGIPGNDDAGTLSAWYVFACLGFFPVPGTDLYLIGTPAFPRAELDLPGGTLVIEAPRAGPERPYVSGVRLDGQKLEVPWFSHADIAAGSVLRFDLGTQPSHWGRIDADTPIPTH